MSKKKKPGSSKGSSKAKANQANKGASEREDAAEPTEESKNEASTASSESEASSAQPLTSAPSSSPRRLEKTPIDSIMRGVVLLLLGGVMTVPLWCKSEVTQGFGGPSTFRAERPNAADNNSIEARIAREVTSIIGRATADEEVDEVVAARTLADILEEAELGDAAQRQEAAEQTVADIVAQAAEADGARGLSDLQAAAIQGQARMTARTLITGLGGEIEMGDEELVPGDWTPAAWPVISGFDYEEGMELPEPIEELDGQEVMAWGYLLQLEEDQFLLVQSLWSCCFGSPPDLHEAIVVRADPETARLEGRGVRVYGRFEASELSEDGYVTSLYRLDAAHVRPM